jgi:hypothetical protein
MSKKSKKSSGRSAKGRLVQFKSASPLLTRFLQGIPSIYPVLKPLLKGSWSGPLLEKVRALAICNTVLRSIVPLGLDIDGKSAAASELRALPEINEEAANQETLKQVLQIYLSLVPIESMMPVVSPAIHSLWLGHNALARTILGMNYDRATTEVYKQVGKEASTAITQVMVMPKAYDTVFKDIETLLKTLDSVELSAGVIKKMGTPAAAIYGQYVYTHGDPGLDPSAANTLTRERELKILIRDENSKARPNEERLHAYRNQLRTIQGFPPNLPRDTDGYYGYGGYGVGLPGLGRSPYSYLFQGGVPIDPRLYGYKPFGKGGLDNMGNGLGVGAFGGYGASFLGGGGLGAAGLTGVAGLGGLGGVGGLFGYGHGALAAGGATGADNPMLRLLELNRLIKIESSKKRRNPAILDQLRWQRTMLMNDPQVSRPDVASIRNRMAVLNALITNSKKTDPLRNVWMGEFYSLANKLNEELRKPYEGADDPERARSWQEAAAAEAARQQGFDQGREVERGARPSRGADAHYGPGTDTAPESRTGEQVEFDFGSDEGIPVRASNPRHLARDLRSRMSRSHRGHRVSNPDYELDSSSRAVAQEAVNRFLRATGGK